MKLVTVGTRDCLELEIGDAERTRFEGRLLSRMAIHDAVRPAITSAGYRRRVESALDRLTGILLAPTSVDTRAAAQ